MSESAPGWGRLFRRLVAGFRALSRGRRMERKRREQALDQREQELLTLLDASPGMLFSFHLRVDGVICMPYVSPRIWELFGLSPQDVVDDAQLLLARIHPDDMQRVRESVVQSARTMAPWHAEYRIAHPTRGQLWMEGHGNPRPHLQGGVVWYGFSHDITERRRLEEALKASEEKSRTLFESANDGIYLHRIVGLPIFAVNIAERKRMEAEIVARAQEFRTLVESAPGPIFRYAPDGRRIYVNAAVERMTGIPAPLLLGGTSLDGKILSSHDGAAVMALVRRICETGEPGEVEVEHVGADGQRRYFHNRFAPELGVDGEVKSVFSICHDITDRKHAEQRLKEALEFSNGVINAIPDILFEVDRDGRYLNVWTSCPNARTAQESEPMGRTIYDALTPENAATTMQALEEAYVRGSSYGQAICINQPNGEARWYEHSIARKYGRVPSDVTFLVLSRDVTKNIEVQQRLDETTKRLWSVLQTMPDMVWLKDVNGVYQLCNHAFSRLIGMAESSIFGQTDYDLFDAELADFFRLQDLKAIEAGTIRLNEEWVNYADDGRRALLETRKVPVYGVDGKLTGVLGIARDITERKEAELALRASEAHIQSRNVLLQAIVESTPEIIIFALDTTYRYLAFNQKHRMTMQAIWGHDICVGMNMLNAIGDHPDRLIAQTSMDRALAGESFVLEETYGNELLSRHHWLNHWAPIRSESGEVVGLTCFVLNISERRTAEERLRRSRDIVRALAAHQETEREKERRRLAYEIHEDLAQNFAALRLHLASLEMGDVDAKHAQVLKTMHGIADYSIARIRSMVSMLRPAVLDLGLVSALQWLTDDFKGVGLDFDLALQDDIVLSDAVTTFLYRAAKEALLNVALHAAATQVHVSLVADEGVCCLVVHDNGCGFDPAAPRGDDRFGLIGLAEGALHLGGELSIESSTDHGTTLEIRVVVCDRCGSP
jgi:PAS domain S-box-containing protein